MGLRRTKRLGAYNPAQDYQYVLPYLTATPNIVRPVINVIDLEYGATGDGITDDATAIQGAIDDASAAGGGMVYFPPGSYYIGSEISTNALNVRLVGGGGSTGADSSPVVEFITNQSIIMFDWGDDTAGRWGGPIFENIAFRDTSGTGAVSGAVRLMRMHRFRFMNCYFKNFTGGYGVRLSGGASGYIQYGMLDHCAVYDCLYGIITAGNATDITVLGGYFHGKDTYRSGSRAISQANSGAGRWRVISAGFNNWEKAIDLGEMRHWVIEGCSFEQTGGNSGNGTAIEWDGDGITATKGDNLRVIGSHFSDWSVGISIGADADYTCLVGNSFVSVTTEVSDSGDGTVILSADEGVQNRFNTLRVAPQQSHTISGGVITIDYSSSIVSVDTQGAASSDDLDTINGGQTGQIIFVRAADSTHTVVVTHNVGNIKLNGQTSVSLNNASDILALIYIGGWLQFGFSDNGA